MNLRTRITRALLAASALATLAGTAAAQGPALVTVDQAADGWISLYDGETLFGWNTIGDAQFRSEGGLLVGDKGSGGWIATTSQFADFELSLSIKIKPETKASIVLRGGLEGHWSENGSGVILIDEPKSKDGGGQKEHDVHVTATGADIKATVDGAEVKVDCTRAKGVIGIAYHGQLFDRNKQACRFEVSKAWLKPLSEKSIFNGTDLTEWNIIPGHPSEFSVVDGAINILHGNGQIETKETYKDFALQLSIISNGKQLNSGVFYRGPVGVFWKGYESQVRNHWAGDDRTKPVDFGTGGNYGNQPSRKVVSTDGEWFHKTVICDGNHASCWINGFQTSDFTDVRPVSPDKDGKVGYVAGPGTIHLQGHDPTTNLSFKNIRIQPYPAKP